MSACRSERPTSMSAVQTMLVNLIRASGRTQVDLAAATGITQKHMSYLMTGRAEGSLTLWSALLAAADVRLPATAAADAGGHVQADSEGTA